MTIERVSRPASTCPCPCHRVKFGVFCSCFVACCDEPHLQQEPGAPAAAPVRQEAPPRADFQTLTIPRVRHPFPDLLPIFQGPSPERLRLFRVLLRTMWLVREMPDPEGGQGVIPSKLWEELMEIVGFSGPGSPEKWPGFVAAAKELLIALDEGPPAPRCLTCRSPVLRLHPNKYGGLSAWPCGCQAHGLESPPQP